MVKTWLKAKVHDLHGLQEFSVTLQSFDHTMKCIYMLAMTINMIIIKAEIEGTVTVTSVTVSLYQLTIKH